MNDGDPDYFGFALVLLIAIAAVTLCIWLLSRDYGPCPNGWHEQKLHNGVECTRERTR